jgi:ABC-type uncharacterized transport system substrate-binding protein
VHVLKGPRIGNAGLTAGRLLAWLALLAMLAMYTTAACARGGGILVVAGSGADLYTRFIERFTTTLAAAPGAAGTTGIEIVYLDRNDLTASDLAARALVITVGTRAAGEVAELQPDTALLHTIIPESVYLTLAREAGSCPRQSAIFIDQPLARQAALAQALFPEAARYGILLGPTSAHRQPEIDAIRLPGPRQFVIRHVSSEANIARASDALLQEVDLMLAVNDPLVLNRENAKWLLYSAYQHRLPVIGFSQAYVNAGASGAVFSEPEQLAEQAAGIAAQYLSRATGCLPAAGFPTRFRVAVNESVCRSLGSRTCDTRILEQQLQDQETGR